MYNLGKVTETEAKLQEAGQEVPARDANASSLYHYYRNNM